MRRRGKHIIKANTLKEMSLKKKEMSFRVTSGELWLVHVGLTNKVSIISFVDIIYMFIIKYNITT